MKRCQRDQNKTQQPWSVIVHFVCKGEFILGTGDPEPAGNHANTAGSEKLQFPQTQRRLRFEGVAS